MQISEQNKTYLTYGVIALISFYGFNKIFGNKFENSGSNGIDPTGNGSNGQLPYQATVFNAKKITEDLFDAMKENNGNNKEIVEILNAVNQNQFMEVVKLFGKRPYNETFGNQRTLTPWWPLPKLDLKRWLRSELPEDMYFNLKRKYNNYL